MYTTHRCCCQHDFPILKTLFYTVHSTLPRFFIPPLKFSFLSPSLVDPLSQLDSYESLEKEQIFMEKDDNVNQM